MLNKNWEQTGSFIDDRAYHSGTSTSLTGDVIMLSCMQRLRDITVIRPPGRAGTLAAERRSWWHVFSLTVSVCRHICTFELIDFGFLGFSSVIKACSFSFSLTASVCLSFMFLFNNYNKINEWINKSVSLTELKRVWIVYTDNWWLKKTRVSTLETAKCEAKMLCYFNCYLEVRIKETLWIGDGL